MYPPSVLDRFYLRLKRTANGCIEWTGTTKTSGYGTIKIDGVSVRTHRLAWEIANGPIPDGLWVLHHCDNRSCCNVDHLFLGTHADNMADKTAKGRGNFQKKTHCPQGHPYDEANTQIRTNGRHRQCRTCRRESCRRQRAKRGEDLMVIKILLPFVWTPTYVHIG